MGSYYKPQCIGDYEFDEVSSSLQKMCRAGREYEAVFWAYILHQSGFGNYLWKRILVISVEDCGLADPNTHTVVNSLFNSWQYLHKENKEMTMDKFLFVTQAVLCICRAKKIRENDSLSNLIHDRFEDGERLEIEEVSLDSHCSRGKQLYGRFGDLKDGKEKLRLDRWFNINSRIENKSGGDKWEDALKELWYGRIPKNNKDSST